MMQQQYIKVRLLDAPCFLDRDYSYAVPRDLEGQVQPGSFVTVPFGGGNRRHLALCTAFSEKDPAIRNYKSVDLVTTPHISLSEEMLGLVAFLRDTTLCSTGDAVHAMIPSGALSSLSERYRTTGKPVRDPTALSTLEVGLLAHLEQNGEASLAALRARFDGDIKETLAHLVRKGFLARELALRDAMSEKQTVFFSLVPGAKPPKRPGAKQKALLALLENGEKTTEDLKAAGLGSAQTKPLIAAGVIAERRERVFRGRPLAEGIGMGEFTLNEEQEAAYRTLAGFAEDGEAHAVLLHGVTGSGKTCVMLKAIDKALEMGRGVLVLLPEIALTPQSLAIFCSRYGSRVAVMHSALGAGERMDTYHRIKNGEADVVVGTRSAIFAPVANLGLIVLDEEHEHTYKSDQNPKYHARDVGRWRAAYHKATLLLCSATPSLESYKRATEGRYTLLKLKNRHAGAKLPAVEFADMRTEDAGGVLAPIGGKLGAALDATLARGEQAILFLNRRGYNHSVSCRSCGEALTCPSCSVTLTYHTKAGFKDGFLMCHFCGKRLPQPEKCPACGSEHLARFGFGTQRVEEELSARYPHKRILRMDTDTTATRGSYEELLGAFRRGEADVLLGTQMVTKGHDFPNVTLVGVLLADASLYLDDYRAGERTFSLLTQVVGRAGRAAKDGTAVIQTQCPDHDILRLAAAQDYEAFFERELALRRLLVFPPFCDIALLTLSHRDERAVLLAANRLTEELKRRLAGAYGDVQMVVFGPFEAPVYRVEEQYRMRLVVKCALNRRSRALFAELLALFGEQGAGTPLLSVDLNPTSL